MRTHLIAAMALALMATTGCKDDGQRDAVPASTASDSPRPPAPVARQIAGSAQFDSSMAAQGLLLEDTGRLDRQAAAGFEIYWPSGCGQLRVREPEVVNPDETQEFLYACDRFRKYGTGCSVLVLQNDRDENGGPPSPATVVKHVERVLAQYSVRADRQRPLSGDGIEGVEVQAVEPGGAGEVWVRGLLAGTHTYILTAWNKEGGLFEDPDARDFFASFRLIQ